MIVYFPEIYEDELMYSVFSRYYKHGGYMGYMFFLEELMENKKTRMQFLFINKLQEEVRDFLINKVGSMEKILKLHTMYPYYSLFLGEKRKTETFPIIPNRKGVDYMKYCPLCVKEDREKHGETYWHRIHQIPEIKVCAKHGCRLHNSTIVKDRRNNQITYTAEDVAIESEVIYGDEKEIGIAKYTDSLIKRCDDIKQDRYGDYLMYRLRGTKYTINQLQLELLSKDFTEFYKDSDIDKPWKLSHVLHNKRYNPFGIIQVAYFLGITVDELVEAKMDMEIEDFSLKITREVMNGKSMYAVSRIYQISETLVHLICKENNVESFYKGSHNKMSEDDFQRRIIEERKYWLKVMEENKEKGLSYSELRSIPENFPHLNWLRRNDKEWTDEHYPKVHMKKTQSDRWRHLDEELITEVKRVIEEIKKEDKVFPQRITIYEVNKRLGRKGRDLYHLPKCLEEIGKYAETAEEFQSRKVVWAIERAGSEINFNDLRRLIFTTRDRLKKCIPLIKDEKILEIVKSML